MKDRQDIDWQDVLTRMRKAALHRGADRVEWHVEDDTVRSMSENGEPMRSKEEELETSPSLRYSKKRLGAHTLSSAPPSHRGPSP